MAVDSVSLLAQNVYSQIQNRPKVAVNEGIQIQKAANFQNMVQKQFNSFAAMSPEQILNHIQSAKNTAASLSHGNAGGFAASAAAVVAEVRSTLSKQETTVRKSLINEASLVDVLTATTEAANTMKVVVSVRDKFMESLDKVMSMTM